MPVIPVKNRPLQLVNRIAACFFVVLLIICFSGCSSSPPLEVWHTEKLSEEFTADRTGEDIHSFDDYLRLEQELYRQLDEKVYTVTGTGPEQALNRYSPGSAADPRKRTPNWNRSFALDGTDQGGVLLLHGMSDSPYSLRALGETLNQHGYQVIGLRLPGHGTTPSGLKFVAWQDMAAAVNLAMEQLRSGLSSESRPIHIIGYSTGASLALDFTLNALEGDGSAVPASLILISPAIRIHRAAKLAGFKNSLAVVPGLGGKAWLNVMDEFDPYKYNSFATNAGTQVHRLTVDVDRRLLALTRNSAVVDNFPPILVFKSAVDFTVTTDAVVDNLLARLPPDRNELVLFDVNRQAIIKSTLLIADPAPFTDRLMAKKDLPFTVTIVSNEDPESVNVVTRRKAPHAKEAALVGPIGFAWPRGVVSLSHVALPIPPDDPLYGRYAPSDDDTIFLGDLAIRGERGLLKIPQDWLLRMRYNPFYDYLEDRVLNWVGDAGGDDSGH